MNKPLLIITAIALMLFGCGDEENPFDYLIQGLWVNTHVNDQPVTTNEAFICDFRADLTQLYAIGLTLDEENKSWIENSAYTYKIIGKTIIIEGPDVFDNIFYLEFTILSLDEDALRYSVKIFKINGEEFPDPYIYTMTKVKTDLADNFVGTWYGRSTTGGASEAYHYWDYFADGTFDYYFKDDEENWIKKPDNEGRYFLYGNLLASNYTNDLLSGETGKAYECWSISIVDNKMTWHGLRENGLIVTFEMDKVDNPPL